MLLGLKKLFEEEQKSMLGKLFQGAGLTAGGVAVYEFAEFFKANPAATLAVVKEFGPIFALAVLLTALMNRLIGVMEKSASSGQEMAAAMRQIADKDDRQAERMELMTQYNAQRSQEAADSMGQLHEAIRLQNSALDRIERRLDAMQPVPHQDAAEPLRRGLPT